VLTTDTIVEPSVIIEPVERYGIIPARAIPEKLIESYWGDLHLTGLLKYRWCDTDPNCLNLHELRDYSVSNGQTYFVVDTKYKKIIGEFTLTSFTGAAAQVHVSTHPNNHPNVNRKLGKKITDEVLYTWKREMSEEPFLDTLYGLTPEPNRAARIYLLRAGFKNMGTLISGTKYEGIVCDAIMSMKTRNS